MGERKSLGNRRRFRVFERDGFRCQYCGGSPPAVILHVDHVLAVAKGGSDDEDNLVTACSNCNHGKRDHALDPSKIPKDYEALSEETRDRAEQLRAYREHLLELREEMESAVDFVGGAYFGEGFVFRRDAQERLQVERFIELIGLEETADAARISRSRFEGQHKQWRYFCGICWKRAKGGSDAQSRDTG